MVGDMTEKQVEEWGNSRVKEENKIKGFKDKTISNCKFLFNLL